jgi:carboxylesterase type B
MVSGYWANFAATGNPNGEQLPHWPSVAEAPARTMEIGGAFGPMPVAVSDAAREFWVRMLTR